VVPLVKPPEGNQALYQAKENGRNGFCIAVENDAQTKLRFRLLE
jgi:hypothetical protein